MTERPFKYTVWKNIAAAKKAMPESLKMTLLQVQQGNELLLDAQLVCQAAFGAQ